MKEGRTQRWRCLRWPWTRSDRYACFICSVGTRPQVGTINSTSCRRLMGCYNANCAFRAHIAERKLQARYPSLASKLHGAVSPVSSSVASSIYRFIKRLERVNTGVNQINIEMANMTAAQRVIHCAMLLSFVESRLAIKVCRKESLGLYFTRICICGKSIESNYSG